MNQLEALRQIRKGQAIRLFDVFLLGPWLVYLGLRRRGPLSRVERGALIAVGTGTIVFNGQNYLRIARELPVSDAPPQIPNN
jgi:hypothetical protein